MHVTNCLCRLLADAKGRQASAAKVADYSEQVRRDKTNARGGIASVLFEVGARKTSVSANVQTCGGIRRFSRHIAFSWFVESFTRIPKCRVGRSIRRPRSSDAAG